MEQVTAKAPKLVTLILLSGLSVVSLNMFLPSLATMAADFEAPYAIVNLSIAGYAAMTAVLQLIVGPLSDRFGRRPVILVALTLFCLASLGCFLASDIAVFLVFRMLQAAIVSGYTVSLAVVRDCTGTQKAASLMGYMAMAYAVAPMIGPTFGGVLGEAFGWRANFAVFALFGAAMLILCFFDLRETNANPSKTLTQQLRAYPELIGSRRFWGYAFCMAFSIGGFYTFLGGAPFVASVLFEISSATLGIYIGSITCGFLFGSFLAGRYAVRFPLTTMMIAGRIVASVGLLIGLAFLSIGIVHEATLFGACIFYGMGNGITLPSSNAGALSVRPALAGSAAGLSGAITVAGGGLMSGVTGLLLTEQTAAPVLLAMMLLSAVLGLAAALYVRWLDRQEAGLDNNS
ncbi:MAG: multidrug effflux MFS transporter [Pseudomonadota bacterium]